MVKKLGTAVRQHGWETAFVDVMSAAQAESFDWKDRNCFSLVADVCMAMTGFDPLDAHRGAYASRRAAMSAMKKLGFVTPADALAAYFEECAPAMARRGDCGVVERDGQQMTVIVMGAMVWGRTEDGPGRFEPITAMTRAYRIG